MPPISPEPTPPPEPAVTPPPAPPTPPPAPAQPASAPAPEGEYISNPFKLFGRSWRALKLNFGSFMKMILTYIGVTVGFTFVAVAIAIFAGKGGGGAVIGVGAAVILGIIAIAFFLVRLVAAFMVLALASARGTKMSFGDARTAGKPYAWRLVGYGVLYTLLVLVGYVLLIVPGFLFQTWYYNGFYLIVDENIGVMAAFSRSKELVKGHFFEAYGPLGVMNLFGLLGIIPILGWIVELILYIVYLFALPLRYVMLKDYKDSGATFPPQSKVNFVLPFLGVVIVVGSVAFGVVNLIHRSHNPTSSSYSTFSTSYPQ